MQLHQRFSCLVAFLVMLCGSQLSWRDPVRGSERDEYCPAKAFGLPGFCPPGMIIPPPCPADPPTPAVAIKVRVPAFASAENEITYLIGVENVSRAPAHHVVVRNALPENAQFIKGYPEPTKTGQEIQWHLGTLHPGDCREIKLVLRPTDNHDLKNCPRVQFEHGVCVVTRLTGTAKAVVKEKGKLVATISGPKQQYVNLPARYHVTVSNQGGQPATNILLANDIPENATFLSATHEGKFLANQIAWLLGTLEPGETRTVSFTVKAQGPGEICQRAKALADDNLSAEAELCTVFKGSSGLLLEMVDRQDPIEVGSDTSFPILLKNTGILPLGNIRIKAIVPESMQITRVKGPTDHKLGERTPQGQVILFDTIQILSPGETAAYEVYVKGMRPGDARFRIEVESDQLQAGPVREEESTNILPALELRPVPGGTEE